MNIEQVKELNLKELSFSPFLFSMSICVCVLVALFIEKGWTNVTGKKGENDASGKINYRGESERENHLRWLNDLLNWLRVSVGMKKYTWVSCNQSKTFFVSSCALGRVMCLRFGHCVIGFGCWEAERGHGSPGEIRLKAFLPQRISKRTKETERIAHTFSH